MENELDKINLKIELDLTKNNNSKKVGQAFPYVAIFLFYLAISILLLPWSLFLGKPVFIAVLWIIISNILILITTQLLHLWLKSPHFLNNSVSAVIRSLAGLLEIIFYTITITFGWFTILAGFLFMKGLSVWKHDSNPNLEGASTGILRIAVILSLLGSIIISVYLTNSDFINSQFFIDINKLGKNF